MNTKLLRSMHRKLFTEVIEEETAEGAWVKRRVKNRAYLPFKEWVRSLPERELDFLTGKAQRIFEAR